MEVRKEYTIKPCTDAGMLAEINRWLVEIANSNERIQNLRVGDDVYPMFYKRVTRFFYDSLSPDDRESWDNAPPELTRWVSKIGIIDILRVVFEDKGKIVCETKL